jgi:hypothetical protein
MDEKERKQQKFYRNLFLEQKKSFNGLERGLLELCGNKLTSPLFRYVIGDMWNCEKSPIGLCVYHHFKDPAHDQCMFCGNPSERK